MAPRKCVKRTPLPRARTKQNGPGLIYLKISTRQSGCSSGEIRGKVTDRTMQVAQLNGCQVEVSTKVGQMLFKLFPFVGDGLMVVDAGDDGIGSVNSTVTTEIMETLTIREYKLIACYYCGKNQSELTRGTMNVAFEIY
ncbi:hypothetical protein RUM43_002940 [Polyplax serrata]|uniref:Uncharacterized protein n=1 Tax=Polyplax serrata TaxID=468196 RepID=A0AAN8RWB1_POLSC